MYYNSKAYIIGSADPYNLDIKKNIQNECETFVQILSYDKLKKNIDHIIKYVNKVILLWDYQLFNDNNVLFDKTSKILNQINDKNIYIVVHNVQRYNNIEANLLVAGVRGIFYEDDSMELIKKGINSILAGELWFSRKAVSDYITTNMISDKEKNNGSPCLTYREQEILIKIAKGEKNNDIAKNFCISSCTVKTHIYNIYKKIGVANRIQATLWCLKNLPD